MHQNNNKTTTNNNNPAKKTIQQTRHLEKHSFASKQQKHTQLKQYQTFTITRIVGTNSFVNTRKIENTQNNPTYKQHSNAYHTYTNTRNLKINKHANKQTNKHANKQTNTRTNRQTNEQTNEQAKNNNNNDNDNDNNTNNNIKQTTNRQQQQRRQQQQNILNIFRNTIPQYHTKRAAPNS